MTGYHVVRAFSFDPADDLRLPEGWKPFAYEGPTVNGTSNLSGYVIARKWCRSEKPAPEVKCPPGRSIYDDSGRVVDCDDAMYE